MAKSTKSQTQTRVKVVLLQDGPFWSVQCLEYDIGAEGKEKEEAFARFEKVFRSRTEIDLKSGRTPFEGVPRAPQKYWTLWEKGKKYTGSEVPSKTVAEARISQPPR